MPGLAAAPERRLCIGGDRRIRRGCDAQNDHVCASQPCQVAINLTDVWGRSWRFLPFGELCSAPGGQSLLGLADIKPPDGSSNSWPQDGHQDDDGIGAGGGQVVRRECTAACPRGSKAGMSLPGQLLRQGTECIERDSRCYLNLGCVRCERGLAIPSY
jgi:hypothetical protein